MDELTNLVVQRTGINQDDAQKAVQAVIDILKAKLPAPISSHIDALLGGSIVDSLESEAGNMIKGEIGGFLGKL